MKSSLDFIGSYAPDFEIPGTDRQVHHLRGYLPKFAAIAVVFLSDLDPKIDSYIDDLKRIQAEFANSSFTLIGIDPNYRQEPIAKILETMSGFARQHQLNFPYLRDTTQEVAKSFGVKVMPTVFLLDQTTRIRYAGAMNSAEEATQKYLRDSIIALCSGKTIATATTRSVGSPIVWR